MKKILVPIDGSEQADKALDFGLDLAKKYSAEVEILHVIPPIMVPVMPYPTIGETTALPPDWLDEYYKKAKEESHKMLSEALKSAKVKGEGLKITSKLGDGRPSDVIVAESESENFDLIVMGSRGLGGIKEFILGSVSNQVVHESKKPVLIVK